MSSLMASSAPGPKPHGEQQFSRAVSSARQDMALSTPGYQSRPQKDSSKDTKLSASPPFRDNNSSPEEANNSAAAPAYGEEYGIDLAGECACILYRHSQHSAAPPSGARVSTVSVCTQEVHIIALLSPPQHSGEAESC